MTEKLAQTNAPPAAALSGPAAGAADPGVALTVDHLRVSYGPVVAVDDVSLTVRKGTITGLIGPNGAGKTTFIDALSGFVPAKGTVSLGATQVMGMRPHRRQQLGIGRTFQSLELFDDLSVEENLLAYCNVSPWGLAGGVITGRATQVPDFVEELLGIFDLARLRRERVSSLSHGHRKIVCIARAMASHPSVLLLDEPAAGLDSTESRWLRDQLTAVVRSGISILLVEHDMDLVMSACDYLYVLDFGKLIAEGTADEVNANPAVVAAYLGVPAEAGTGGEAK